MQSNNNVLPQQGAASSTPPHHLGALLTKAERMDASLSIRLVAIDYVQLMGAVTVQPGVGTRSNQPRAEGNRQEPQMSHLRDSGCLEQDADLILILHRDKDGDDLVRVLIRKQRDGALGETKLIFARQVMRFMGLSSPHACNSS